MTRDRKRQILVRNLLTLLRNQPWQTKSELALSLGSNVKTIDALLKDDDRLSNLRKRLIISRNGGPRSWNYALAESCYNE